MTETVALPAFPVPDFDEMTAVWGAPASAYLTPEQMGKDFYAGHHPMCRVASEIFYRGGKLSDFGLKFKASIDGAKAMRALKALLCSYGPKHEVKIGTVGVALANWCERITAA